MDVDKFVDDFADKLVQRGDSGVLIDRVRGYLLGDVDQDEDSFALPSIREMRYKFVKLKTSHEGCVDGLRDLCEGIISTCQSVSEETLEASKRQLSKQLRLWQQNTECITVQWNRSRAWRDNLFYPYVTDCAHPLRIDERAQFVKGVWPIDLECPMDYASFQDCLKRSCQSFEDNKYILGTYQLYASEKEKQLPLSLIHI